MEDLRQSALWSTYLQSLGWKTFLTKDGTKMQVLTKFRFTIAKAQRPNNLTKDLLNEIEQIAKNNNCFFILLEPIENKNELLTKYGFKETKNFLLPPKTLLLNLKKSENELWKDLSKSAKYSVRRAKREKVKINIYKNATQKIVRDFYLEYSKNSTPKKLAKFSQRDLQKKIDIFKENSFLFVSYDENDELCGGILCLAHKKSVWYLHGGTTKLGRKNKSNYLLFWTAFLYFKKNGYEFFDLDGLKDKRFKQTKSWEGFSDFKKRMGGFEKTYPPPYIKHLYFIGKLASKFNLL